MVCVQALPALVRVALALVRVDPVRVPAALASVLAVPADRVLVDPALVRVVLAHVLAAPVDRVPAAPAARPWVVRAPVVSVARVRVDPVVAPVDPEHVLVAPVAVATVRTASVAHRARSRVHVVVATWKSCNRSS